MVTIISQIGKVARARGIRSALQFQKATGFAYSTANALYSDDFKRIGFDVLSRVCEVLEVEPGEIIVKVIADEAVKVDDTRSESKNH